MDRAQLADFLRRRREALQPEDVGLDRGRRRRVHGLRREEVAALANMSTYYYAMIEQRRGPQPSRQLLAALARGLRLTLEERDHLFQLAGHSVAANAERSEHVSPAMMHVLDRLDTPAQVYSDLGETLFQNPTAVALFGHQTAFTGSERSTMYRWFADPTGERRLYPEADHGYLSRVNAACVRAALAKDAEDGRAAAIVERLQRISGEFAALWTRHEVGIRMPRHQRLLHPVVGEIELDCHVLVPETTVQMLLMFTAAPGSADEAKLRQLAVIGRERLNDPDSHQLGVEGESRIPWITTQNCASDLTGAPRRRAAARPPQSGAGAARPRTRVSRTSTGS